MNDSNASRKSSSYDNNKKRKQDNNNNNNSCSINGIKIILAKPDSVMSSVISLPRFQKQLEACWLKLDELDLPLTPRIIGNPGSGKTSLAYSVAKKLKQNIFVFQCSVDTRAEDLIITPVLDENKNIRYHASPLLSAFISGGICLLDEASRMNEKAWAALASMLDERRTLYSLIAGIKITAHDDFRCCVTMNDDASSFEVPEYIMSRLQPVIKITPLNQKEEHKILKVNVPFAHEKLIDKMSSFLYHVHQFDEPFSTKDGINIIKYAQRLIKLENQSLDKALIKAIEQILGEEAVNYLNPDYQPSLNIMNDMSSVWEHNYMDEDDNELV